MKEVWNELFGEFDLEFFFAMGFAAFVILAFLMGYIFIF